ncbi:MAG: S8/S53 family peptidase [Mycobacteriales bacterium]
MTRPALRVRWRAAVGAVAVGTSLLAPVAVAASPVRDSVGRSPALAADSATSAPALPSPPSPPGSSGSGQVNANGPSGMDLNAAFAQTQGSAHTLIAYVEGGINWHLGEASQLVNNIYVNWRQLPIPCSGATIATASMIVDGRTEACQPAWSANPANYDIDHDGVINSAEWAHDPRVRDVNGNGYIDPEDLIAAFSCYDRYTETLGVASWPGGVLHCSNGAADISNTGGSYPHDISGWNFYRNNNDPATADAAYTHADDQMTGILSTCPKCMILPVKAGAEAMDFTDTLAKAWLFAGYERASVITSVTADLGFSSYMHQAIDYLHRQGVVMVEASNDFDSTDHQGGMFWPHVIPGNGVVPNAKGTAWVRSNFTSWGTHNMFSVAGATTTSQCTAELGGLFGLLLSYGQQAYASGVIPQPLTGPEAVQVMRAASVPITDTGLGWPGAPGAWSLQYGYGIPNLSTAMDLVAQDAIPPVPSISSPRWYGVIDPTRQASVPVTGSISSADGGTFQWTTQAALGAQPAHASWFTIGTGHATGSFRGQLGSLATAQIPSSFWSAAFQLSTTKSLASSEQYAVSLRVIVTDGGGLTGVTRRAINVVHDPSWLPGFPLKLSTSGESQPALVDLQGTGHLDLVFGTSSGRIDAIDPATGRELPGWPAYTPAVPVRHHSYPGVDPGHEAVIANVAVGDLFHNGHLEVVATTENGYVSVFSAKGKLEPGWPKVVEHGVVSPGVPRPALPYTHLPVRGALAAPVLVDLAGTGQLDIVQAGWDGYVHAWSPTGTDLAGWPVQVTPPPGPPPSGYIALNNYKVVTPPAVAYLQGRSAPPDLVVRSEFTWVNVGNSGLLPYGFVYAYSSTGQLLSGWPVKMPGLLELTDDAMEFLLEGWDVPVSADITSTGVGVGTGTDEVAVGPVLTPPYLINGTGTILGNYGAVAPGSPAFTSLADELANPGGGSSPPDVPLPLGTSGAFGRLGGLTGVPGVLTYGQAETGLAATVRALLLPGSQVEPGGHPMGITEWQSLFPAAGGPALPGFPAKRQGLDFFGMPMYTSVTSDGAGAVIESGDSSALQAYTLLGAMAPGFPKWTSGWTLSSPSAGDLLSTGQTDLVLANREGYVFAWQTPGPSAQNNQWWRAGHDEYNSNRYGAHTRPPGVARDISWRPGQPTLSFLAPGNDWYSGTVGSYQVTLISPSGMTTESVAPSGPAGSLQQVAVPSGTRSVTIQAIGTTGLLGLPVSVPADPGGPPPPTVPEAPAAPLLPVVGLVVLGVLGVWFRRRRRPPSGTGSVEGCAKAQPGTAGIGIAPGGTAA